MAGKRQTGQGGFQTGLPGLDWQRCGCGCSTQFLRSGKGRYRQYYDDTHKKRAYRERKAVRDYNDQESERMWRGYDHQTVEEYAQCDPDALNSWWAQYELDRRTRLMEQPPSL